MTINAAFLSLFLYKLKFVAANANPKTTNPIAEIQPVMPNQYGSNVTGINRME